MSLGISSLREQFYWLYFKRLSVQYSRSVASDSLRPYGLQHTRLPCPSPNPRACSNSSPSSQWCHPTISSSVVPFSSCLQSSPASGSFPMSQFFASGGQSIGASASVLPMNIQDWLPLGLTSFGADWFHFLAVKGTLKSIPHQHSSKVPTSKALADTLVNMPVPWRNQ